MQLAFSPSVRARSEERVYPCKSVQRKKKGSDFFNEFSQTKKSAVYGVFPDHIGAVLKGSLSAYWKYKKENEPETRISGKQNGPDSLLKRTNYTFVTDPPPLPYNKNEGLICSRTGSRQRKLALEGAYRGNEMAPLLCYNRQTALLLPTPRLP